MKTVAQEDLNRKVELAWLAAFYGGLLTDKQREVLSLHCEEDLSLGEISREVGISRQGVHDMLSRSAKKLFSMEEALGMAARFNRLESGLEQCRDSLRAGRTEEAAQILDGLIQSEQEESNGL